jgi:methionyl aminopeptidase
MEHSQNILLKTSLDISRIRRPSRALSQVFMDLKTVMKPGVTTLDIERFCVRKFNEFHAIPSQAGYRGFPSPICTSPNSVAAHGIPNSMPLEDGDIITVDIVLAIDGWHSDSAWTYLVGTPKADRLRLLKAAWQATMAGIGVLKAGNRLGDVGDAIGRVAKKFGCSVIEDFAGHGIGEAMHEDPIVSNSGTRGVGQPIVPGMVLTVEPILSLGKPAIKFLDDGWTAVTEDGCPTAQFEHTVAIFHNRNEILTFSGFEPNIDLPPFF